MPVSRTKLSDARVNGSREYVRARDPLPGGKGTVMLTVDSLPSWEGNTLHTLYCKAVCSIFTLRHI